MHKIYMHSSDKLCKHINSWLGLLTPPENLICVINSNMNISTTPKILGALKIPKFN